MGYFSTAESRRQDDSKHNAAHSQYVLVGPSVRRTVAVLPWLVGCADAPGCDSAITWDVGLLDEVGDQHPQHGDPILGRLGRVVGQERGKGRSGNAFSSFCDR